MKDVTNDVKLQLSKNGVLASKILTNILKYKNLPNHYKLVRQSYKGKISNILESAYLCLEDLICKHPQIINEYAMIQDRKITYGQMRTEIINLSKYLHYVLKCNKGENISICAASSIEGIIAFFAESKLGLVNARIFNGSMPDKLQYNIENFNSNTILIDKNNLTSLEEVISKTTIKHVIMLSDCSLDKIEKFKEKFTDISIATWNEVQQIGSEIKEEYSENVSNNDIASILYTSGSSGEPKPITISNKVYTSMVNIVCKTTNIKKCDHEKVVGVVSHEYPYAAINSTIMILLMGKTLVMPVHNQDGHINFEELYSHEPDRVQAIPNYYKLLEHAVRNNEVTKTKVAKSSCIVSGGEAYLKEEKKEFLKFISTQLKSSPLLIDGFGFGEMGSATALKFGLDKYFLLMNGIEAKAIDPDTHAELPLDKEGILCFSGPTIAENYYNNETATQKSFVKDENNKAWFISDTYGSVHGRLKRLIKLGGRIREYFITGDGNGNFVKVYAGNVEDVILSSGLVKDCIVVPSDSSAMPKPIAYISLREDCNYTHSDIVNMILAKCNSLENFSRPVEIKFEDEIQRTEAKKKNYTYYKLKQLEQYDK